jgi:hypothetical protein
MSPGGKKEKVDEAEISCQRDLPPVAGDSMN